MFVPAEPAQPNKAVKSSIVPAIYHVVKPGQANTSLVLAKGAPLAGSPRAELHLEQGETEGSGKSESCSWAQWNPSTRRRAKASSCRRQCPRQLRLVDDDGV